MTFVASYLHTRTTSHTVSPVQAGDVVLIVVIDPLVYQPSPAGWSEVFPTGRADIIDVNSGRYYRLSCFWRRVPPGATSVAADLFDTYSKTVISVVMRGPTALAAAAAVTNNSQAFRYPGVFFDETMNGDVVYVAAASTSSDLTPSGTTGRQQYAVPFPGAGVGIVDVSTATFSTVTSLPQRTATPREYGRGITLAFGAVAGPQPPQIVSPESGSADLAAGFDIAWVPSWAQTGYAVRTRPSSGGSWSWWDGDGFDSASEVIIPSTSTTVTIPAAHFLPYGATYTIEVATRGDELRPELGQYASVDVAVKAAPGAPGVTVSDVSGTAAANLVTNGTFETDTAGWNPGYTGSVMARDASTSRSGAASLRITFGDHPVAAATTGVAVTQGQSYRVSMWAYVSANSPDVRASDHFVGARGPAVSTRGAWALAQGEFVAQSATLWAALSSVGAPTQPGPHAWLDDVYVTPAGQRHWPDLTTFTPTLTLTGGAGAGATFTGYRVQVWQDARMLHEQTVTGGTWAVPVSVGQAMTNRSDQPVWIRAAIVQDGTMQGPWTTQTFDLRVPVPAAPTLTATHITHPTSGLPGVQVSVTPTADGTVTLYRDGVQIASAPAQSGAPVFFDDYSGTLPAIYGATITTTDTIPVTSDPGESAVTPAVGDSGHCWLSDPADPSTAVRAHCVDITESYEHPVSIFRPLTADAPVPAIVHSMPVHTPTGTLTVTTDTHDETERVIALLTSGRRLSYRRWHERPLTDPQDPGQVLKPLIFVPVGPLTPERLTAGPWQDRNISVAWVQA